MKLIWTVCVTWSILYAAEAVSDLQCWTCDDETDSQCADVVLRNCTNEDDVCFSSVIVSTVGPRIIRRFCIPIDRCGDNTMNEVFAPLHTNMGPGNGQLTGICCNTTGCNSMFFDVPENPFVIPFNGLKCFTCLSPFDLICHRINQCRGRRTKCVNSTVIVPDGRLQRAHGCASQSWCEGKNLHLVFFSPLITLSTFLSGPFCCDNADFCNGNISVINPNNPILQVTPVPLASLPSGSTVPLLSTHLLSILPLTLLLCSLIV